VCFPATECYSGGFRYVRTETFSVSVNEISDLSKLILTLVYAFNSLFVIISVPPCLVLS
jgi:hypothetical protein